MAFSLTISVRAGETPSTVLVPTQLSTLNVVDGQLGIAVIAYNASGSALEETFSFYFTATMPTGLWSYDTNSQTITFSDAFHTVVAEKLALQDVAKVDVFIAAMEVPDLSTTFISDNVSRSQLNEEFLKRDQYMLWLNKLVLENEHLARAINSNAQAGLVYYYKANLLLPNAIDVVQPQPPGVDVPRILSQQKINCETSSGGYFELKLLDNSTGVIPQIGTTILAGTPFSSTFTGNFTLDMTPFVPGILAADSYSTIQPILWIKTVHILPGAPDLVSIRTFVPALQIFEGANPQPRRPFTSPFNIFNSSTLLTGDVSGTIGLEMYLGCAFYDSAAGGEPLNRNHALAWAKNLEQNHTYSTTNPPEANFGFNVTMADAQVDFSQVGISSNPTTSSIPDNSIDGATKLKDNSVPISKLSTLLKSFVNNGLNAVTATNTPSATNIRLRLNTVTNQGVTKSIDTTLPAATSTAAGVLSAADKSKVDTALQSIPANSVGHTELKDKAVTPDKTDFYESFFYFAAPLDQITNLGVVSILDSSNTFQQSNFLPSSFAHFRFNRQAFSKNYNGVIETLVGTSAAYIGGLKAGAQVIITPTPAGAQGASVSSLKGTFNVTGVDTSHANYIQVDISPISHTLSGAVNEGEYLTFSFRPSFLSLRATIRDKDTASLGEVPSEKAVRDAINDATSDLGEFLLVRDLKQSIGAPDGEMLISTGNTGENARGTRTKFVLIDYTSKGGVDQSDHLKAVQAGDKMDISVGADRLIIEVGEVVDKPANDGVEYWFSDNKILYNSGFGTYLNEATGEAVVALNEGIGGLTVSERNKLNNAITGVTVQDEGSALATGATTLNFTGSGVTASGSGAVKTINVSGGGGGDVTGIDAGDGIRVDDGNTATPEVNVNAGDGLEFDTSSPKKLQVDLDGSTLTRSSTGIKVTTPLPAPGGSGNSGKVAAVNSAGTAYELVTQSGGGGGGDVTGIDAGDGIRVDDGNTATPEVNVNAGDGLEFDTSTPKKLQVDLDGSSLSRGSNGIKISNMASNNVIYGKGASSSVVQGPIEGTEYTGQTANASTTISITNPVPLTFGAVSGTLPTVGGVSFAIISSGFVANGTGARLLRIPKGTYQITLSATVSDTNNIIDSMHMIYRDQTAQPTAYSNSDPKQVLTEIGSTINYTTTLTFANTGWMWVGVVSSNLDSTKTAPITNFNVSLKTHRDTVIADDSLYGKALRDASIPPTKLLSGGTDGEKVLIAHPAGHAEFGKVGSQAIQGRAVDNAAMAIDAVDAKRDDSVTATAAGYVNSTYPQMSASSITTNPYVSAADITIGGVGSNGGQDFKAFKVEANSPAITGSVTFSTTNAVSATLTWDSDTTFNSLNNYNPTANNATPLESGGTVSGSRTLSFTLPTNTAVRYYIIKFGNANGREWVSQGGGTVSALSFTVSNVTRGALETTNIPTDAQILSYSNSDAKMKWVTPSGGGALTVKEDGTALSTNATGLNFTDGLEASGTGAEKTIKIPAGEVTADMIHKGGELVEIFGVKSTAAYTGGGDSGWTGLSFGSTPNTGNASTGYSIYTATWSGGDSITAIRITNAGRYVVRVSLASGYSGFSSSMELWGGSTAPSTNYNVGSNTRLSAIGSDENVSPEIIDMVVDVSANDYVYLIKHTTYNLPLGSIFEIRKVTTAGVVTENIEIGAIHGDVFLAGGIPAAAIKPRSITSGHVGTNTLESRNFQYNNAPALRTQYFSSSQSVAANATVVYNDVSNITNYNYRVGVMNANFQKHEASWGTYYSITARWLFTAANNSISTIRASIAQYISGSRNSTGTWSRRYKKNAPPTSLTDGTEYTDWAYGDYANSTNTSRTLYFWAYNKTSNAVTASTSTYVYGNVPYQSINPQIGISAPNIATRGVMRPNLNLKSFDIKEGAYLRDMGKGEMDFQRIYISVLNVTSVSTSWTTLSTTETVTDDTVFEARLQGLMTDNNRRLDATRFRLGDLDTNPWWIPWNPISGYRIQVRRSAANTLQYQKQPGTFTSLRFQLFIVNA